MNAGELFTRDEDLLEMETEEMEHDMTNNPDFKSEQFYSCDICLKVFKNESLFCEHKKTHAVTPKVKTITKSHDMKLLVPKVEKQNFYVCDICALVFVTEESLVAHSQSHKSLSLSSVSNAEHSSATEHSQDFVGVTTGESQGLTSPKDGYPCTICHTTFYTSALLSTHLEASHNKHFTCSHCKKKTFTSYLNLTKHICICHPKRTQSRSLQASIQLLKKRKENVKDNTVVLSVDRHNEQPPEEIKGLEPLGENESNDPQSSVVEESEELKHDVTSQPLDKASDTEFLKNVSRNHNFHTSQTNRNNVETSNNTRVEDSELKQNEFRGEGSEIQERSLTEAKPVGLDRSMPNFQNNTNLIVGDFEQLRQTEIDEFHYSSDMKVETHDVNNTLGNNSRYLRDQDNVETNDIGKRNCINDQSLCDAEIDFRLEDEVAAYLMKRENCLDVEMAKLPDHTPKPAEQLSKSESQNHSSEAPLTEQQEQGTTVIKEHNSVESKFCGESIGQYIIQNSPTYAGVLQESPIGVMGNIDKFDGSEPTEIGLGHDMMAGIVDNEILSVEDSDFCESNLNSAGDLLSGNEMSKQKHMSVDPLIIHKDNFRKTKDCFYSLEDALDKLEAQNTE
jgi:hypothetical protein